jgi:hypothetical protein
VFYSYQFQIYQYYSFIYYSQKIFFSFFISVKYFSENIASLIASGELTDSSFKAKKELFVITNYYNIGDCKIHPFLKEGTNYYDDSNITKCNDNLEIDPIIASIFLLTIYLV